jgi:hypothetical protein
LSWRLSCGVGRAGRGRAGQGRAGERGEGRGQRMASRHEEEEDWSRRRTLLTPLPPLPLLLLLLLPLLLLRPPPLMPLLPQWDDETLGSATVLCTEEGQVGAPAPAHRRQLQRCALCISGSTAAHSCSRGCMGRAAQGAAQAALAAGHHGARADGSCPLLVLVLAQRQPARCSTRGVLSWRLSCGVGRAGRGRAGQGRAGEGSEGRRGTEMRYQMRARTRRGVRGRKQETYHAGEQRGRAAGRKSRISRRQ